LPPFGVGVCALGENGTIFARTTLTSRTYDNVAGLCIAVLAALFAGCQPSREAPAPNAPSAPTPAAATDPKPLPPLTDKEKAHLPGLRRHVQMLGGKIGERNADKKWELADASDYLAGELEQAGYAIDRQGYDVAEIVAQNLAVQIPGARLGKEIVLVGAHYDSARGTPGADDDASGVAAVLELARTLSGSKPERTLRFVLFANEEQPFFQTETMGSLVYAKRASQQGETISAMLSIDAIGYFCDAPGCQSHPEQLGGRFPTTGDFLAVVGNDPSRSLVDEVLAGLVAHASLPAHGAALPSDVAGVAWSDHWSFWQLGWRAILVTDTAPFRNPHYHRATDTPDKLDFDRMARVVAGLAAVVRELAGINS
jgi:hypothetical protein